MAQVGIANAATSEKGPFSPKMLALYREDRDVSAIFGLDRFNCQLLRAQFSDRDSRRADTFADHVKIVLRERHEAFRWIERTDDGRVEAAIATAESFRAAIDALPVGRDIRNRLIAHLGAHIAALRGEAR